MNITNVRIKLTLEPRLVAYASITIDDAFVVNGVRVVRTIDGRLLVAMPNRKAFDHCGRCSKRCDWSFSFCPECGSRLDPARVEEFRDRGSLFIDVAHPVSQAARDLVEKAVLGAFYEEMANAESGVVA